MLENNEDVFDDDLIKHANTFRINNIKIEEKNNKKEIFKKIKKNKSYSLIYKQNKKIKEKKQIELSFSIENYIKQKIKKMYYYSFLSKLKVIYKEKLKVKQKEKLLKLMNHNNMKIIKHYMNRYKEKIVIGNKKQNIFYSLIRIKPKYCSQKKVNNVFNFKLCYRQNILKNLINKYGFISYVKNPFFLWKKKTEEEKKNIIIDKNEDNVNNANKFNEDKKEIIRKLIRIKKVKKKPEENYNFNDSSDFDNFKEDKTLNDISSISINNSCDNGIISDSMESDNIIQQLATVNKKMKKKVIVDQKKV